MTTELIVSVIVLGLETTPLQHKKLELVMSEYLIGWFLARLGKSDEARPPLEEALTIPVENVFKWKASELLRELEKE